MGTFILSNNARDDIGEILTYGWAYFGKAKAIEYLVGLRDCFKILAEQPGIGKKRDEIKAGLLSFPYESHSIFYRRFSKHIRIVRVLYGGRDIIKVLR